jgi:hypothetical protein
MYLGLLIRRELGCAHQEKQIWAAGSSSNAMAHLRKARQCPQTDA